MCTKFLPGENFGMSERRLTSPAEKERGGVHLSAFLLYRRGRERNEEEEKKVSRMKRGGMTSQDRN